MFIFSVWTFKIYIRVLSVSLVQELLHVSGKIKQRALLLERLQRAATHNILNYTLVCDNLALFCSSERKPAC